MAYPITTGANPTNETIPKDVWTLVLENVNFGKVHNLFGANQTVWVRYMKTGDPAPVGLDLRKIKIPEDYAELVDGSTLRDVYIYSVGESAKVGLEA